MADGGDTLTIKVVDDISRIAAADWDACAGPENPFLCHAFLSILENSGSVAAGAGWWPRHLILQDDQGAVRGAVPMYAKGHSYGEYVFDHAWAEAYQRAGGRYYPKLQIAVPFTPVTGPRLLLHPGLQTDEAAAALIGAIEQVARQLKVSSVHATFPAAGDWQRFTTAGWLPRIGMQFHWDNAGYGDFDAFLEALNSRKRKAVRKERREVADSGVELVTLTGGDLQRQHWQAFYQFYLDTSDRKWGQAYLTESFFHLLGETMADRVVLILARHHGDWVAGALNLLGSDTLYGRNWGCAGDYKFLHFEACYYRAIDFAIKRGLRRVEAGAQGRHKIQRGYLPTETYSAHWFRDPGLGRAIADYLDRERPAVQADIATLAAESPFRQTGDR